MSVNSSDVVFVPKTIAEIESFLTKEDISSLNLQQKSSVSRQLQEFLSSEKNGANSKFRRRISRFIEMLTNGENSRNDCDNDLKLEIITLTKSTETKQISLFIQALSKATHISEIEKALNSFHLQNEFNVIESVRNILQQQLTKTLNNRKLTNKRLR